MPWHLAEKSNVSRTVIWPTWRSCWLMYTDVFCGTNSLCLCPLNVTFPCTRRFLSRLSASAKRNVVFPELGGPSNNVSLQLSTQNLQVRYYIYTNPNISQFLEYIKSNLRMFSRFFWFLQTKVQFDVSKIALPARLDDPTNILQDRELCFLSYWKVNWVQKTLHVPNIVQVRYSLKCHTWVVPTHMNTFIESENSTISTVPPSMFRLLTFVSSLSL